ncbi:MAG: ABC-F family ATP-binding cassette domain-containing protein, partial [Clostridia bacterium]|nr:ABC-F family ATP-binding cassette domain-containing protein [Clostridia bacterium]
MIAINVNNISKNYGFGELFKNLSFVVNEGDRVALIGQNGTGKSTLLKIIAGKENLNSGSVDIKRNSVIGYLEQQISDTTDTRLCKDILLSAFKDLFAMEEKLKKLEDEMTNCQDEILLEKLINKYSKEQEVFMELGGYEINTKIDYVLSGLKIEKSFLEKRYDVLSGGEKTLIQFAQILLSNPDILLLDEPTNHLDIKRMEWLENYLSKYNGTVIIVSHDRYFLDKVVKKVFEIDNQKGTMFKGNYSSYVKEKENLELKVFEQYKNQQKKIASMKEAIKRLKEWGERGDNPTMFRRANAIQKRLDMMEEIERPKIQKALPINFVQSNRSSNECVVLKDYSVEFKDKIIFKDVNFKFFQKDKVALVGDNGSGKSTLLKSIVGEFK